jgi:hypothetical protein
MAKKMFRVAFDSGTLSNRETQILETLSMMFSMIRVSGRPGPFRDEDAERVANEAAEFFRGQFPDLKFRVEVVEAPDN